MSQACAPTATATAKATNHSASSSRRVQERVGRIDALQLLHGQHHVPERRHEAASQLARSEALCARARCGPSAATAWQRPPVLAHHAPLPHALPTHVRPPWRASFGAPGHRPLSAWNTAASGRNSELGSHMRMGRGWLTPSTGVNSLSWPCARRGGCGWVGGGGCGWVSARACRTQPARRMPRAGLCVPQLALARSTLLAVCMHSYAAALQAMPHLLKHDARLTAAHAGTGAAPPAALCVIALREGGVGSSRRLDMCEAWRVMVLITHVGRSTHLHQVPPAHRLQ